MRVYKIYYLMNELSGEIFYVGSSAMRLKSRLINHLCIKETFNKPLFDKIKEANKNVSIHEIEECTKEDVLRLERFWIQQFICWNFPIVNIKLRPSNWGTYICNDGLKSYSLSDNELLLLKELTTLPPYKTLSDTCDCSKELIRLYFSRKKIPKWAKEIILPFCMEKAKKISDIYSKILEQA